MKRDWMTVYSNGSVYMETQRLSVILSVSFLLHMTFLAGGFLMPGLIEEPEPVKVKIGIKTKPAPRSSVTPPALPKPLAPPLKPALPPPANILPPAPLPSTMKAPPSIGAPLKLPNKLTAPAPSFVPAAPRLPAEVPNVQKFQKNTVAGLPPQEQTSYAVPDIKPLDISRSTQETSAVADNFAESAVDQQISAPSPPVQALTSEAEETTTPSPSEIETPAVETDESSEGANTPQALMEQLQLKQAERQYNFQLLKRVKAKFYAPQHFDSNLVVQIKLVIGVYGDIQQSELTKSSGVKAFDLAAMNAIRSVILPPLPKDLAKNPPYIVVFHFSP